MRMRKLGYILLILGFIWFCLTASGTVGEVRPLTDQHMKELTDKQAYTRDDVYGAIRHAVFDFATILPLWYFPSVLLMFSGGIILDVAGRRKRV